MITLANPAALSLAPSFATTSTETVWFLENKVPARVLVDPDCTSLPSTLHVYVRVVESPSKSESIAVAVMVSLVYAGSGARTTDEITGAALLMTIVCVVGLPSMMPSLGLDVHYTESPATSSPEREDVVETTAPPFTFHS